MNRAGRRKAGNTEKPKTYVMTQAQIDKLKLEATEDAFWKFMAIPLMVLHDKFGFGKIRGTRFMDYVLIWYESVQSGETKMADIMKIAEDLSGVQVIMDKHGQKKP